MRVLAGDVGGTKTDVAIAEVGPRRLSIVRVREYPSGRYATLEEVLEEFLASERRPPVVAALGVAGPVQGGKVRPTKLPWIVEETQVSQRTGIRRVRLLNDFAAAALGIPYLKGGQLALLARGSAEMGGPIGLLGAGTGLGQAALVRVGGSYVVISSEGGHADFGPRNPREDRLAHYLRQRYGRVSRDRLLSGEGLAHLYDFLKADGFAGESRPVALAMEKESDRAAVISRFALARSDALCEEALAMFVSIYGSEAGNLALHYRAGGGIFLAGGIAPKILPALRSEGFLEAFRSKPPMEKFLAAVPVRVVREPRLGLLGAAAAAYRIEIETARPSSKTTARWTRW